MSKRLTLGEFTINPEFKIPSIEVLIDGEVHGHMTPFRGYYFQISATYDGECDLGNSLNHGYHLKHFLVNNEEMDNMTFKSLALTAIYNYTKIRRNWDKDDIVIDVRLGSVYGHEDTFEEFIKASVEWVKSTR